MNNDIPKVVGEGTYGCVHKPALKCKDKDDKKDPNQVSKMTKMAIKYENFVITSNRKNRKESRIIIFLYYIHLLMTFLLQQQVL